MRMKMLGDHVIAAAPGADHLGAIRGAGV